MWRHPPFLLIPVLMLFGSAAPLGFALISQYALHYPPCHFCLLQRYPYALILIVLLPFTLLGIGYRNWVRIQGLFALLAWLMTAAIAFYHVGVERGIIDYQGECVSAAPAGAGIEDIKAAITAAPLVSCKDARWEFLGRSMAFWNGITGLVLAALMAILLRRTRRVA